MSVLRRINLIQPEGELRHMNFKRLRTFLGYQIHEVRKWEVYKDLYSGMGPVTGNALLMYVNHPFRLDPNSAKFRTHINSQCAVNIVQALNNLGYVVDVIHWENNKYETNKVYDIVIGIGQSFDYNKSYFTNSKLKIHFATGMHWLAETHYIYERNYNLQKRRGVILSPRRLNNPYYSVEKSDVIFSVQNQFSIDTFKYANKPIFQVLPEVSFREPVDFGYAKTNNTKTFLWISGAGMILKGLDLVLEAFAELPDCKLMICTDVTGEPDFEKLYYDELYNTNNIRFVGFCDIASDRFKNIVNECIAVIFPYPEGEISGSLINSMYYGCIPVISHFSDNIIPEFAVKTGSTVEEIKKLVIEVCNLSDEEINIRSTKTLEYVDRLYSPGKELGYWEDTLKRVIKLRTEGKI